MSELTRDTVGIRPGVSILSVLRHLNYKPWFALAEFVDNSVQSFLTTYREERESGDLSRRLVIDINIEEGMVDRLTISDNAGGISIAEFPRAFRPASVPLDRSGLSEYGMGMKSAACWFAPEWEVRTKALGETVERTVRFNIQDIVEDDVEQLEVYSRAVSVNSHYTEITLFNTFHRLHGRTLGKIRMHLGSIYRMFLQEGFLQINVKREPVSYSEPEILNAPYFKSPAEPPVLWRKEIDLDFGLGWRVTGFAALRARGSTTEAGFALFRRKRLIEGSGDETYRPRQLFGETTSFAYQRLFGELTLNGFDVSHTKDGFRWEEHEELFVDELKRVLNEDPLPLLRQAEGYRARQNTAELHAKANQALEQTSELFREVVPPVIQAQLEGPFAPLPESGVEWRHDDLVGEHNLVIDLKDETWSVSLSLTNEEAVSDWLSHYDFKRMDDEAFGKTARSVGIRLSLAHPFMRQFSGAKLEQIQPLLRLGIAIVIAEVTAVQGGVRYAGEVRRRVNQLLREALAES